MSKHFSPSRPVARLATLSAALWLAGCSFIPTFSRPAAPVAESFPTASAQAPAADTAARTAADIEWQTFFKDARLKRLIELAL
ncbi:MAG: multidrug transporter, partial [Burkholderiaceae bacterium]|nr:multidrug transporter [Burkholderiaceae bacterium]